MKTGRSSRIQLWANTRNGFPLPSSRSILLAALTSGGGLTLEDPCSNPDAPPFSHLQKRDVTHGNSQGIVS